MALFGIISGLTLVTPDTVVPSAHAQSDPLMYVPLDAPCRVARTQGTGQTHLIAGAPRDFFSFGSAGTIGAQGGNAAGCDHPRSSQGVAPVAIAANVTAVGKQASGNGNIVAYPAGAAAPAASTVNYTTAANIANSTLIKLRTSDGSLALLSSFSNVPAIVDVVGYYYLIGEAQQVTVDCPAGSIQAAIDAAPPTGHLTVTINGTCNENVLIRRDGVTLKGGAAGVVVGQAAAEVEAAIEIEAARDVVIDSLSVSGGALSGILGIDGAVFFVDSSFVESNALNGIVVDLGSSAVIESSTITNNGAGGPIHVGVGILVINGANAEIDGNTVEDNNGDGIEVVEGAFARLENNSIKRNGRAGVVVSRAVARAQGNTYLDNAAVAIEVYNAGSYRTGSWLTAAGTLDNVGPFESISAGTGQLAVDVGQHSFADLRQVNISGPSNVGHMSMMQVRGDKVGPSQTCSTMNNGAGNTVDVYGANAVMRFDYVAVTGTVTGSGTVIGLAACP
jgi:parallel beta-helix repeat protein